MQCPSCHRDQPESLFRRANRLLKTCGPCREARATAQRARSRAAPRIELDLPAPGSPFRARLHHGDARDVLAGSEPPDLIVTDPRHGIESYRKGQLAGDGELKLAYAVLALAIRRLRPGAHAYVFGDARQPFLPHGLARAFRSLVEVLPPLAWGAGGQPGPGRRSQHPVRSWDYVAVWERRPDNDVEPGALRAPARAAEPPPVERRPTPSRPPPLVLPARARSGPHAAQKPLELLKQIIAAGSRIGDLVLDPFAGEGSTGVAALELGRRFLGVEPEEHSARIAAERIGSARWPSVDEALIEEAHWSEGLGDWWEQIEPTPAVQRRPHAAPAATQRPAGDQSPSRPR